MKKDIAKFAEHGEESIRFDIEECIIKSERFSSDNDFRKIGKSELEMAEKYIQMLNNWGADTSEYSNKINELNDIYQSLK